jgi:hypothetical protein
MRTLDSSAYMRAIRIASHTLCVGLVFTSYHLAAQEEGEFASKYRQALQNDPAASIVWGAANEVSRSGRMDDSAGVLPIFPPLPGEQAGVDATEDPNANKSEAVGTQGAKAVPRVGLNQSEHLGILMPPLKEYRRMNESKQLGDMYKELITSRIPVMGQTFYMVENGAATGYFQALNTTSNLNSQIIQTLDSQFALMDRTDAGRQMADAYVAEIYSRVKNKGAGEDASWLSGILGAIGDQVSRQGSTTQETAFAVEDSAAFTFAGLKQGSDATGSQPENSILVSDILFNSQKKDESSGGSQQQYDEQARQHLQEEFKKNLVDLKIEFKGDGNADPNSKSPLRRVVYTRVLPQQRQQTNGNAPERYGVALAQWEETAVVWEAYHRLLHTICTHKKDYKENYKDDDTARRGSEEHVVTLPNFSPRDWENASAPDISMNLNVLYMGLRWFFNGRDLGDVKCDELKELADVKNMPQSFDKLSKDDMDNCLANTSCARSRISLHIAYTLGRSRTLYRYQNLYLLSKRFAATPTQEVLLGKVFDETFNGFDLQADLAENRTRWMHTVEFLGRRDNAKTGAANALAIGAGGNVPSNAPGKSGGSNKRGTT